MLRSLVLVSRGWVAFALLLPGREAAAQGVESARVGFVVAERADAIAIEATRPGSPPPARKHAVGAFVLEYLVPGAGHYYAGDSWGAINIIGAFAAGTMMGMEGNSASVVNAGIALAVGARVWGLIDAPRAANRYNRRVARGQPKVSERATAPVRAAQPDSP